MYRAQRARRAVHGRRGVALLEPIVVCIAPAAISRTSHDLGEPAVRASPEARRIAAVGGTARAGSDPSVGINIDTVREHLDHAPESLGPKQRVQPGFVIAGRADRLDAQDARAGGK
jgi:hypothetical protein